MNFVFCEWVLFYTLATKQYTVLFLPNSHVNLEPRVSCALHNSLLRAKDGKRQRRQGLNVLAVFPIPPSATSCTHRLPCRVGRCFCTKVQRGLHRRPAPFAREANRFIYFIWRGSAALSVSYLIIVPMVLGAIPAAFASSVSMCIARA